MENLRAWARQPTTIAGFSAAVAAITALLVHQLSWSQAVPVLAGAVISMVLPDNSAAQLQARDLANAVVTTLAKTNGASP